MTKTDFLTIPEVASRLDMTPDGVYKLIQRGKLEAVRLSERKTRVAPQTVDAYIAAQQEAVAGFRSRGPQTGTQEGLTQAFRSEFGATPADFLAAWKAGRVEDTPENMQTLAKAASIASMESLAVAV